VNEIFANGITFAPLRWGMVLGAGVGIRVETFDPDWEKVIIFNNRLPPRTKQGDVVPKAQGEVTTVAAMGEMTLKSVKPREATIVRLSITVAVMSCGLLLGIDDVASAADRMVVGQASKHAELSVSRIKSEEGQQQGVQTIRGEVLRIEHENYFVKQYDGKEVQLQIDEMTLMTGYIGQGEQIEAKVNEQNHALSIRSAQTPRDRRNAKP